MLAPSHLFHLHRPRLGRLANRASTESTHLSRRRTSSAAASWRRFRPFSGIWGFPRWRVWQPEGRRTELRRTNPTSSEERRWRETAASLKRKLVRRRRLRIQVGGGRTGGDLKNERVSLFGIPCKFWQDFFTIRSRGVWEFKRERGLHSILSPTKLTVRQTSFLFAFLSARLCACLPVFQPFYLPWGLSCLPISFFSPLSLLFF